MAKFIFFKSNPLSINESEIFSKSSDLFKTNKLKKEFFVKESNLIGIVHCHADYCKDDFLNNDFVVIVIDGSVYFENKKLTATKFYKLIRDADFENFLNNLIGGFSIFIYFKNNKKTLIIRDSLGIKPVYIADKLNNGYKLFLVASTAGAINQFSLIVKEFDRCAIARYASCNYRTVYRSNKTFFKNIDLIPPSHYCKLSFEGVEYKKYSDIFENLNYDFDSKEEKLKEEFRELLSEELSSKLLNHQGKAILALSGGIDSGVIASSMRNDLGFKGDALSVNYPEDTSYKERSLIEKSVKMNINNHYWCNIRASNLLEDLNNLYPTFDTPISTISIYAFDFLMRFANNIGYNLIFNGGGGDTLFAGNYPAFLFNLADLYFDKSKKFENELNYWIINQGTIEYPKSKETFLEFLNETINLNQKGLFKNKIIPLELNILDHEFTLSVKDSSINQQVISNSYLRSFMINEYFLEVLPSSIISENISEWQYGTNFLSPYYSNNLVKFAFKLPNDLKIKKGLNKILIRKIYKNKIPNEIQNFKNKIGLNAPFDAWIRKELKEFVYDIFNSLRFRQRGIYNIKNLQKCIDKHMKNEKNYQMLIWQAINLELWMKNCIDKK